MTKVLSFAMHAYPWMCSWSDFPTFCSSDPIPWDTEGNDAFLECDLLARTRQSTAVLLFSNLYIVNVNKLQNALGGENWPMGELSSYTELQ